MDGRPAPALFRLPSRARRSPSSPSPSSPSSLSPSLCATPQEVAVRGAVLIFTGIVSFIVLVYTSLLSKLLPPSGLPFLDAARCDWYYSLVVPLTGPVILVAVYFHWLSMKLFKHA